MRNWSVDIAHFNKKSLQYRRWRLEQLINYGLDGEKLGRKELKENLPYLVIDPNKKRFLQFLLQN